MTTFTAKQIKAIKKAEKMIQEAHALLQSNIGHLTNDILVAQYLSRVDRAAGTGSLIEE